MRWVSDSAYRFVSSIKCLCCFVLTFGGGHWIEHVHIMLYQAPRDLLDRVTQGDRPVSESWSGAAA